MTRGVGLVVGEREKSLLLRVIGYEGFLKDVWVPKKLVSRRNVRFEGVSGALFYLPYWFARNHRVPEEVFVLSREDFFEVFHDFYDDIYPVLSRVFLPLVAFSSAPLAEDFLAHGLVPFRLGRRDVFIPLKGVFGVCGGKYLVLASEEWVNGEKCEGKVYKSFTVVLNGRVYVVGRDGPVLVDDVDYLPEDPFF